MQPNRAIHRLLVALALMPACGTTLACSPEMTRELAAFAKPQAVAGVSVDVPAGERLRDQQVVNVRTTEAGPLFYELWLVSRDGENCGRVQIQGGVLERRGGAHTGAVSTVSIGSTYPDGQAAVLRILRTDVDMATMTGKDVVLATVPVRLAASP